MMRGEIFSAFKQVPPALHALLDARGRPYFCPAWIEAGQRFGVPPNNTLRLVCLGEGDDPARHPMAFVAGYQSRDYPVHTGARVLYLGQPNGMLFRLLLAEGIALSADILVALMRTIAAARPRIDIVRIGPLDPDSAVYEGLVRALRGAGFVVQPYYRDRNRFELVEGLTAQDYLAHRPSALRNTLRRKGKKLWASDAARFELITDRASIERGIKDYHRVFAASWKRDTEALAMEYTNSMMRIGADLGALRLGLIYVDDTPAAVQLWFVGCEEAICFRLAYDTHLQSLSAGSLLSQKMIERVIDVDKVARLDFGVGDEPFKADWMTGLREYWGLVGFNTRSRRGLQEAALHIGGRKVKDVLERLGFPVTRGEDAE